MGYSEVFVIVSILGMALWRRDVFFYLIASPVSIVAGLSWRGQYDTGSGMVVSLALIGLGIYCLIMGIYNTVRKFS